MSSSLVPPAHRFLERHGDQLADNHEVSKEKVLLGLLHRHGLAACPTNRSHGFPTYTQATIINDFRTFSPRRNSPLGGPQGPQARRRPGGSQRGPPRGPRPLHGRGRTPRSGASWRTRPEPSHRMTSRASQQLPEDRTELLPCYGIGLADRLQHRRRDHLRVPVGLGAARLADPPDVPVPHAQSSAVMVPASTLIAVIFILRPVMRTRLPISCSRPSGMASSFLTTRFIGHRPPRAGYGRPRRGCSVSRGRSRSGSRPRVLR